jgi:hypothetical protein
MGHNRGPVRIVLHRFLTRFSSGGHSVLRSLLRLVVFKSLL